MTKYTVKNNDNTTTPTTRDNTRQQPHTLQRERTRPTQKERKDLWLPRLAELMGRRESNVKSKGEGRHGTGGDQLAHLGGHEERLGHRERLRQDDRFENGEFKQFDRGSHECLGNVRCRDITSRLVFQGDDLGDGAVLIGRRPGESTRTTPAAPLMMPSVMVVGLVIGRVMLMDGRLGR